MESTLHFNSNQHSASCVVSHESLEIIRTNESMFPHVFQQWSHRNVAEADVENNEASKCVLLTQIDAPYFSAMLYKVTRFKLIEAEETFDQCFSFYLAKSRRGFFVAD